MRVIACSRVTITEPTHRSELTDPIHLAGWDIARATFQEQRKALIAAVTDLRVFRVAIFLTSDPALKAELLKAHRELEARLYRRITR